jgi:hypothetical protein
MQPRSCWGHGFDTHHSRKLRSVRTGPSVGDVRPSCVPTGGRGFRRFTPLHVSPCDNNPGGCVKAADGAALTGRGANGRNPMALWGERGPLRIIIIIIVCAVSANHSHSNVQDSVTQCSSNPPCARGTLLRQGLSGVAARRA